MSLIDLGKVGLSALQEWAIPQRLVFHHVPKCGGTSVGRALRQRCILSQATVKPEESFRAFEAFTGRNDREEMLVDVLDLREQMMLYLLYEDVRCISLHVRFSEVAYDLFKDRYKFVTILREPIQRFISHYYWSNGKPEAHARIDEDFESFLSTERAQRLGSTYSEFYSGLPRSSDFSSDQAIRSAIDNIRRFDVVGRLDDIPTFQSDIKKAVGITIKVGHENRMRKNAVTSRKDLAPELLERARTICQPDIDIWNSVVAGEVTPLS